MHNRKKLSLQNSTTDCEKLSIFLAEFADTNNVPVETQNDMRLVSEETFVNIANYAFADKGTHAVHIEVHCDSRAISISFIDSGIAFNPLTDCDNNIEENNHCEGGMGIHIIKSLTDKQEYKRIDNRNVLTVTKHYTIENDNT